MIFTCSIIVSWCGVHLFRALTTLSYLPWFVTLVSHNSAPVSRAPSAGRLDFTYFRFNVMFHRVVGGGNDQRHWILKRCSEWNNRHWISSDHPKWIFSIQHCELKNFHQWIRLFLPVTEESIGGIRMTLFISSESRAGFTCLCLVNDAEEVLDTKSHWPLTPLPLPPQATQSHLFG